MPRRIGVGVCVSVCGSSARIWQSSRQLFVPGELFQLVIHSLRYQWIPADKTIICSASPWFRASGCVWCLPLVNWLEKDGRFEISPSPFVYFLPYRQTVCPDRPLSWAVYFCPQFASTWEQGVGSDGKLGCLRGFKRTLQLVTEEAHGKKFKSDTYSFTPEQKGKKIAAHAEVIVLVRA